MHVAVFQSNAAGMTPDQRIDCLQQAAVDTNADLMVCPELFLSGYAAGDDVTRGTESIDGPHAQRIAKVARDTKTAIVYGYPETADGKRYNAAQCIDASGRSRANHRKLALPPGFEADMFSPGQGLTLFELGGIKFGLLICYDAEFPETVRAAAIAGAQVVLVPTALGDQWDTVANRVIPARAFENGIYLLYANHAGTEGDVRYLGSSCIVGPDGVDLARAGEVQTVISAKLDPARTLAAQQRLPYHHDLQDLRPRITAFDTIDPA